MKLRDKWSIKPSTIEFRNRFFENLKKNKIIQDYEIEQEIIYNVKTNFNKIIRIMCVYEYIFSEERLYNVPENIDLINIGFLAFTPSEQVLDSAIERNLGITRDKYLKEVLLNSRPIRKSNLVIKGELNNERRN